MFDYEIKEVDYEESLKFHKENSIFNSDDFDKSFGLYQDNELIQLVSLKGNKIINYSINNYVILSRDEESIIFNWLKRYNLTFCAFFNILFRHYLRHV